MHEIEELQARLERLPPKRYPVQHATTCFHLGALLADSGRPAEAVAILERSVGLFDEAGLRGERAKALNALGAARRLLGDERGAAGDFAEAADAFRHERLAAEEAAALHNLGLVTGEIDAFRRAREGFAAAKEVRAEAASVRELAARLLEQGAFAEAESSAAEGMTLAERAGDLAGLGSAANLLGLVHLAAERPQPAIEAFKAAAGGHPRDIRPAEHAMAKANLALAHERSGDPRRARLAARQALAIAGPPPAVQAQAEAILARLPPTVGDLVPVLVEEPAERRPAVVREELARWAEADAQELEREARAWIAAAPDYLLEPLLASLLELPPAAMERIATGLAAAANDPFRDAFARTAVRFPPPQLARLEQAFTWS